jgi:hypothetical protein
MESAASQQICCLWLIKAAQNFELLLFRPDYVWSDTLEVDQEGFLPIRLAPS